MRFKSRKIAGALATLGVGFALLGSGVYAQFTSGASATDKISTGSFGVAIGSTVGTLTPAGCSQTTNVNPCTSVTLDTSANPITSSAAASQLLPFTITNVGSIPVAILHIASVTSGMTYANSPFSDALGTPPVDQTLAPGANKAYSGGISWTALAASDLGQTVSVTYTVSATG